jgi:hypothetical protein
MDEKRYIPDEKGTVSVSGCEDLVGTITTDLAFLERLEAQVEAQKEELRRMAKAVLQASPPGAKRVYFHGPKGRGVSVTAPDLTKEGNLNLYSEKLEKAVAEAGGLGALGIPQGELFTQRRKVTVTAWVADWLLSQLQAFKAAGQLAPGTEDLVKTKDEVRLQPAAVEKLRGLAPQSKVAEVLLEKGIAKMPVKAED